MEKVSALPYSFPDVTIIVKVALIKNYGIMIMVNHLIWKKFYPQ